MLPGAKTPRSGKFTISGREICNIDTILNVGSSKIFKVDYMKIKISELTRLIKLY
jgi:hypothetical protein